MYMYIRAQLSPNALGIDLALAAQALLANVGKLPVADLVLVCQQQKESNCMVMFLRAVTAAGIMETGDEHLPVLQCLTDSEG